MKKIKLVIWLLFLATLSNAQIFRANTDSYSFPFNAEKPMNVQVTIKTQKSFCMSRFEFLTSDNELIFKDEFMMNKEKVIYDVPISSGDYSLVYTGTSGCTNKHFDISLLKTLGDFEEEPNDTPSLATHIQEKHFYTGALQKPKDEDYYKVIIDKQSSVKFVFKHKVFTGYGSFVIDILDTKLRQVTSFRGSTTSPKSVKKISLNAGIYFIKVYPTYHCYQSLKYHKYNLSYSISK